jgi:hypothetical protein
MSQLASAWPRPMFHSIESIAPAGAKWSATLLLINARGWREQCSAQSNLLPGHNGRSPDGQTLLRHRHYNIHQADHEKVLHALLLTFAEFLGDDFSPEAARAWKTFMAR